jgi:site-specific DNA recombinase
MNTIRSGIYTRISSDPRDTQLGVKRQEDDARQLVALRGWDVADVYQDNDESAFNGHTRPEYRRLLDDIRAGVIQAVVAWHPDRLTRDVREQDDLMRLVRATGCKIETVRAGAMDVSTASGRMMARMLGVNSTYESEHRSERLVAKHKQLAEAGEDAGGGQPFGFASDRKTIREDQAELIREAASRVLAGEGLRTVCMDWNRRGIPTVTFDATVDAINRRMLEYRTIYEEQGEPVPGGDDLRTLAIADVGKPPKWTQPVMKRMLVSARISGRRERRNVDGVKVDIGTIVAKAVWPAIITAEQSNQLRSLLGDAGRRTNLKPSKQLLTGGLAVCAVCGAALVSRPKGHPKDEHGNRPAPTPSLVCAKGPGYKGCGGIRIQAEPLDEVVSEAVLLRVDAGALAEAMRSTDDRQAVTDLEDVEKQLAFLAGEWAGRRLDLVEWEGARAPLRARQSELKRLIDRSRAKVRLAGLPDPLRDAWPALELHRRRAVIAALVDAVVVARGRRGLNRFDPDRVTIRWKA